MTIKDNLHPDLLPPICEDLVQEAEFFIDRITDWNATTWEVMQMLEHIKARAVNQATKTSDN